MDLKSREKQCLDFIIKFSQEKLYFPVRADIAQKMDVSESTAQNVLRTLTVKGDIEKLDYYHFRLAKKHLPKKTKILKK